LAHMERERILILSHSYKPFLNPRAFRWTAIAEHWASQGNDVDIICSWLPGLRRYEIVNGVEVHRIGGGVIERLRAILRPKERATTASSNEEFNKNNHGLFQKIFGWILPIARFVNDKIWKNIYWPDYACLWIAPAAAKALELYEMEKYGTVISVSDPFSSHLAGKQVKSNCPDTNWLVDIGDPFSFRLDNPTNNHKLYRKYNYRKEGQMLALADCISVTTEITRHRYTELFSGTGAKIKVIPPMMTESADAVERKRVLSENKNIKLVYVGTLYRTIRNPEHLLKLFKALLSTHGKMNAEIHFFGGYDDCREIFEPYQLLFADKLSLHGLVNRTKVFKAMSEADILVNIGNDNSYQLPSKLVEYAWLGKPIVNLYSIDNDSSKEFLKEYPAILNLDTRPNSSMEEQVRKLADFINRLPIKIEESFLQNWKRLFSVETISGEYLAMLNRTNKPEAVPV